MQMSTKLECINPILVVRDIKVSLDYYVRVLGFEKAEWVTEESTFAIVSRDGFGIYLSENPKQHSKAHVWIGAEDIGPLHEEFMAAGAHIERPPTNYSWAYEMSSRIRTATPCASARIPGRTFHSTTSASRGLRAAASRPRRCRAQCRR